MSETVLETTQHFSASGITSAAEEESYQAAEREAFFNSADDEEDTAEDLAAYTLTDADSASIIHQLEVTNSLIGTQNAILIFFAVYGLMRFFMRLIDHNIFKYI